MPVLSPTEAQRTEADKAAAARKDPGKPTHVFIVHGRDPRGFRNLVARIVNEATPLEATILSEKPNRGMHLLEKFQEHAHENCIAVILMTGDDTGYLTTAGPDEGSPRARQNVVLELGYFISKLPKERVVVLYEPGVERPSDFEGLAYHELSKGWADDLAREFDDIGINVNFRRVPRT